jgi:pimeloyl-ACP methyl ester carboxylesterase/DNA-binding CsgD family transcriptional regulator
MRQGYTGGSWTFGALTAGQPRPGVPRQLALPLDAQLTFAEPAPNGPTGSYAPPMSSHGQLVRFAELDGRRVAWATVGEGPPMVMGGWWMSHLELDWRNRRFRDLVSTLARHRTIVRYDSPGTGLSDREGPPPRTLDEEVAVLAGVVRAVGAPSVVLFAGSAGGPIAARYAAEHPDRVERLVLYGSYANGAAIADPAARALLTNLVRTHWGLGSRVLADVFMPGATAAEREEFAAFQRESAPAELAARSLEATYAFDAEEAAGRIRSPTAVLHRRDDRAIRFELGRELAARIPGAVLVPLEGADHLPWHGDAGAVARAVLEFAGVGRPAVGASPPGAGDSELTARELEVLRLVAEGLSDAEIAERLVLSPHTVHRHVANIRTKLGLASRAAAAAHAARLGLL